MNTRLLYTFLFFTTVIFSQRTYMPDDVFEQHMIRMGYDNQLDDYVSTASIATIKTLNLGGGIIDPTGIEDFAALETLNFSNNEILNINLSQLSSLKHLDLRGNKLQTLDVGLLVNLEYLDVTSNELTNINIDQNTKLTQLYLSNNKLQSMSTQFNGKLERLSLSGNLLTTINISNNTKITTFNARENNALTSLNMSNLNYTNVFLDIRENPNLYCVTVTDVEKAFDRFKALQQRDSQTGFSLDCSATTDVLDVNFEQAIIDLGYDVGPINGKIFTGNVSSLTTLTLINKEITDLTGIEAFANLESLSVRNNNLTTIDLSSNLKLSSITLDNNQLTTFNASSNLNLVYLSCNDNVLTTVDLSQNTLLDSFYGNNNKLVNLDFSNHPNLRRLEVTNNLLANLNITSCENLERIDVTQNNLPLLNLFSNKKLERLYADNNSIKNLDLRLNTELTRLRIKENELYSLNAKNGFNSNMFTFEISNNPNLTCVEVDDVMFSNEYWTEKDTQTSFSVDCAPANDDCAFAIPLVIGQETPGDINSGTFTNATDCVAGTVIADVWYSITIPDSGEFSVQGSGFGGLLKFAVYESCESALAVSCGINISLTNLTPGDTYYLRVWMEETSSKTSNSQSGTFTFTASESSVLSVNDFSELKNELLVYPNPASSSFSIKLQNENTIDKIQIFNSIGVKMFEEKNINYKQKINISKFAKGIYIIKATSGNRLVSKKLIIK